MPEIPCVHIAVRPEKFSLSVFLVLVVKAFESRSVSKRLFTLTFSHIKLPLTLILTPIDRMVSTNSMRLIVIPLSNIYITVRMQQSALSSGYSVLEVPAISTAIRKVQFA